MTRWVHGVSKDILRAAFREYFGVSDEHADILVVLYGRPNEWTPMRRLQVLLDSHRPPKRQAVYERIRVLREAMNAEALMGGDRFEGDGAGYALSEVGFAECAVALRMLCETLLKAGPRISLPGKDDDPNAPISVDGVDDLSEAVEKLVAQRPAPLRTIESLGESITQHRLISIREAANRALISPATMRMWSKEGKAPSPVRAGLKFAYLEAEFDEWLRSLPRCEDQRPTEIGANGCNVASESA